MVEVLDQPENAAANIVINLGNAAAAPAVETHAQVGVAHHPNVLPDTGSSPWLPLGGGILALTGLSLFALRRRSINDMQRRDNNEL